MRLRFWLLCAVSNSRHADWDFRAGLFVPQNFGGFQESMHH